MATTLQDLTGKKFGKLTVIERCENRTFKSGKSRPQWLCLCDCGNYKKVPADHLRNGHTTSCGCNRHNDLTGKRFGRLTVVKLFERYYQPHGLVRLNWLCKCDCGETTIVSTGNLTSGHTISCGCMRCSAQEAVIIHVLKDRGILYEKEYILPELETKTGRRFRFDFALFDEDKKLLALLEYQGSQHFIETKGFEEYGETQRNFSDALKREYCKTNNIPLYEITYKEDTLNKLNDILRGIYGDTVPSLQETA